MNTKSFLIAMTAIAALTACSNEDLFDPSAIESQVKADYAKSFTRHYPNVDLNQSWDYTTPGLSYSLSSTAAASRTRAGAGSIAKGGWYEVDNNTLTWMHDMLTEGDDHRNLGNPFYMTVPGNDFTIVPIYQGVAGAVWDLHMVVGNDDYLIWSKSEDIEIQDLCGDKNPGWHGITMHPTYEWNKEEGNWWESLNNTDGSDKRNVDNELNIVTATRAKTFTISGFPVGEEMYFYLKVTKSANDNDHLYQWEGAQQSSIKGMMLALDNVPRPANIGADNEVMIIGCEDADLQNSDWDMNDVVFLVYGKSVPKPIEIKEGDGIEEKETVRYMIEDLGSTDDFDFNDIVVDVSNVRTLTPVYTNGVLTDWKETGTRQEATIRHLGGTLPFILQIGNTKLEERQGVLGQDPNETFEVTGWNSNTHNISVQVQQLNNAGVYNNVKFPKAGEAPMIIAVDPTQGWMSERQSVPESWFYTVDDAE